MVLEYITDPISAETKPSKMFFFGFIYAILGLFLGYWVFYEHNSLIMVFLSTMAVIPIIYNIIKIEEKKDLLDLNEKNLLKEHSKAISVFMYYFLGTTIAFAFMYIILPEKDATNVFKIQIDTILSIRSSVTGQAINSFKIFSSILANNVKVLAFCVLFSFLYGIGAIFILTWNASVIGFAIGDTIKTGIYQIGKQLHITTMPEYLSVISYGLLKYSIHGIPEILAYLVAGLAGGIISSAVIRHDFGTSKYVNIIMDSSVLLIGSLLLLVFAAWLEVYVTPLFF
ncbi:MAG: stage II sporulation protein M [Candidatus Woesearchaeota archaeon]